MFDTGLVAESLGPGIIDLIAYMEENVSYLSSVQPDLNYFLPLSLCPNLKCMRKYHTFSGFLW